MINLLVKVEGESENFVSLEYVNGMQLLCAGQETGEFKVFPLSKCRVNISAMSAAVIQPAAGPVPGLDYPS